MLCQADGLVWAPYRCQRTRQPPPKAGAEARPKRGQPSLPPARGRTGRPRKEAGTGGRAALAGWGREPLSRRTYT